MNKKNNRRTALTKKIFKDTLIELLRDRHISDISVKSLCEAADMNRSTFYSHYENQMAILREIEEETYQAILSIVRGVLDFNSDDVFVEFFKDLLEYVYNNQARIKVLIGPNVNRNFINLLQRFNKYGLSHRRSAPKDIPEAYIKYMNIFRINGSSALIQTWLEGGCKESPHSIAELLARIQQF